MTGRQLTTRDMARYGIILKRIT